MFLRASAVLILATHIAFGQSAGPAPLSIGATAPDFRLPGVDGKVHRIGDYRNSRILAIVFQCNTCPVSQMYDARIAQLARDYRDKGVALVAINPNNPGAALLTEQAYSDVADSLEEMKIRAAYRHIEYPYLYDGDAQSAAAGYGPAALPQIYLFDQERRLRYTGQIDDSPQESRVASHYAREALEALLAGDPVTRPTTAAAGCPVAWKRNAGAVAEELKRIEAEPVNLTLANAGDLTALRANPTGQLMLVNFWATWCGPCVGEFPDLQAIFRIYRQRGFALVTVSENAPGEREAALQFLRRNHASSTNRLFATADTSGLQEAFDHNMGAAVPFTVVIAPNGDVVYQEEGALSILELRRAILQNLPETREYSGLREYWSNQ